MFISNILFTPLWSGGDINCGHGKVLLNYHKQIKREAIKNSKLSRWLKPYIMQQLHESLYRTAFSSATAYIGNGDRIMLDTNLIIKNLYSKTTMQLI